MEYRAKEHGRACLVLELGDKSIVKAVDLCQGGIGGPCLWGGTQDGCSENLVVQL